MTQDEIIEMARQANGMFTELPMMDAWVFNDKSLEAFAKLVEAHTRGQIFKPDWDNYRQGLIDGAIAEREACAQLVYNSPPSDEYENPLKTVYETIRNRGEA